MSVATYFSQDLTQPGMLEAPFQFRAQGQRVGLNGFLTPTPNISFLSVGFSASTTTPAFPVPGITPSSVIIITSISTTPAGTWTVSINPTGGSQGQGSFTITSTATETLTFSCLVSG